MDKENITQMCKRHEAEIEELQRNCNHPKVSNWIWECWAVAHFTGNQVKVCEVCGKIVEKRKTPKGEWDKLMHPKLPEDIILKLPKEMVESYER